MTTAKGRRAAKRLLLVLGVVSRCSRSGHWRRRRRTRFRRQRQVISIDPVAATNAYLASMPADKKARSDAYFEGGYWLQLWGFLVDAVILLALLHFGVSARIRSAAVRMTGRRPLQTAIYAVAFALLLFVLSFPWSVSHRLLPRAPIRAFDADFRGVDGRRAQGSVGEPGCAAAGVDGALTACFGAAGASWWIWGALVTVGLMIVVVAIGPVYIAPIFNTYTPLKPSPVRDDILRLAHANGIRAQEVYEVDASRQTTRVSANVSGILGTERITLNDNLLSRASPEAIQAVLGHEMGHYVLNHAYKLLLAFGVIVVVGFALIAWSFDRLASRRVARWGVAGVDDPAGLPLIVLLLSTYLFLLTPVLNTITRTSEFEADMFGLNAARQPDGFAEAALLLSDYRKMDPGPLEEIVFYDHPSGRTRIFTAMQWKAYSRR